MPNLKIVAMWKCKCGASLKAVAEAKKSATDGVVVAQCPNCGEKQNIHADTLLSVDIDTAATNHF